MLVAQVGVPAVFAVNLASFLVFGLVLLTPAMLTLAGVGT